MAHISENDIEEADIALFEEVGFEHIDAWKDKLVGRKSLKDVVLVDKLREALTHLNPTLPKSSIDDAIAQLTQKRVSLSEMEANQEVYTLIKEGVPVSFSNDEGKEESTKVSVLDFNDSSQNLYHVVSQLTIEQLGNNRRRRPDLILYVNGLPLVMVELKNASKKVKDGYDDNLQNYRADIPQLFYYNVFVLISNSIQTRIGSFTAQWEHFFTWTRTEDSSTNSKQKTLEQIEAEGNKLSLEIATESLCSPKVLLDYIENFVLYHRKKTKIIAKNHQYLGVNATVKSLKNRDGSGKLGTFWHTQGSGKSYSMIFFSKKVNRKLVGNWSFLIVTDRNDLDDQIFKNFLDTETLALSGEEKSTKNQYRAKGNGSKKQLAEALGTNKSFFFTTIFNFGIAKGKTYTQKSDRDDWILIVDEAHRTNYKSLGENMRIALPKAQRVAFTGTPILKNSLTKEWFGDYVSEYNFAQSIADGATVPLFYKKAVPRVQNVNEDLIYEAADIVDKYDLEDDAKKKLDKEYSTLVKVVTREDRLEEIAQHIVNHFPQRLNVKDEEGNRKPMKAMVVSINKFTSVKMYEMVKRYVSEKIRELNKKKSKERDASIKREIQDEIDFLKETKMAVVISQEGSDKDEREKFDEKGLDIRPHRKLMDRPDEDGRDIEDYFKDPDNVYRIVFVTAMWMTGFDAPSVSTLYLDKPMKNHNLMQTIARANRVFEAKKNGLIIDYFGVFRNLKKALSDYAEGSSEGEDEMPVQDFDALLDLLAQAIVECKSFLLELDVDIDAILQMEEKGFREIELFTDYADKVLVSEEKRKGFNLYVHTIVSLFDSAKPEVFAQAQLKKERDVLLYLKDIISRQLDKDDELQKARVDLDKLLDESVVREGDLDGEGAKITEYKQIDLAKLDIEKLKEEFPKKEHKNIAYSNLKELMEIKLKQMMAANATRGKFLEKFEAIIEEYNNGSMTIEEKYDELLGLFGEMDEEDTRAAREGLSEQELEIFDLLKKEKLSKKEKSEVKQAAVALLARLKEKREELFRDPWYKEKQEVEKVEAEIRGVLDKELPSSYNRELFMLKNKKVFEHIAHLAEMRNEEYLVAS
ncbi:MAG: deoxyribonuclease [Sulfurovum sp.]|nr:MAG: deoxyribonuclease [Sulfurovum sp.]